MKPEVELEAEGLRLRAWRRGDEPALVKYANNRKIWRNLSDRFPHPYRPRDARWWVDLQDRPDFHEIAFAIEHGGEAVGGIGLSPRDDLQVKVGEIGYWVGEPFWGQGLATAAVVLLTRWAFAELDLVRIYATVLDWNPGSARVLEKAGYELEARLKKNIFKDGEIIDSLLYASVRGPSRSEACGSGAGDGGARPRRSGRRDPSGRPGSRGRCAAALRSSRR